MASANITFRESTETLLCGLSLTLILVAGAYARRGEATGQTVPGPVFVSDDPQSIYARDSNDPWNRIFRSLFTRTVTARLSDAFAEGASVEAFEVRMGSFP